ncbi:MAG TPA: DUF3488 and transglutaminase-like domain-containing protein [Rhodoglobus sp.]|nr:DUF3488 and transglutaminase-like domain-containing protein [Rhodoglobus sp.]
MAARRSQAHWLLSALILVAIGIAAAGLSSVLSDVAWWFMFMLVTLVVLLAAAIVRSTARHRVWASVAGLGAAVASITLLFAPGTALLGIIPTFATFDAFHQLELEGTTSIAAQSLPADADKGIVYLICLGAAAIALAADTVAHQFRTPALVGVPLLALLLVPSLVRAELSNALVFMLTAVAWLAIMLFGSRPRRFAIGTAAAALAASLVLPLVLPAVEPSNAGGAGSGLTTGLNPIITLGNDLRRADPTLALTYTTSVPGGQYLRLTALDNFTGESWEPTATDRVPGNGVDAIGPVPGLGADVPRSTTITDVTVASTLSRWLPVPYAPESITGLDGDWWWEPDGLSIRTESSNARNQEYEVQSVDIAPSIEQLVAAGSTVEPGLERYLVIPEDLPAIVAKTAREVVGAAESNYDKAIAMQAYFRGGDFTYSQDAPVEQGFDGSGAAVLGAFLEAKSGYCVHFSSAMAAMARTLGIPARVVVGFTQGVPDVPEGTAQGVPDQALPDDAPATETLYRVSTDNLHAWPELYFAGIGWVRFEPTPGRGSEPAFAPLSQDDPSTPDVDESVPPKPTSVPTSAPSSAPSLPPEDPTNTDPDTAAPDAAAAPISPLPFLLVLLVAVLATPWALRLAAGRRRVAAARAGSTRAAWQELTAVVTDLGIPLSSSLTPRQAAAELGELLDPGERDALNHLTAALEAEAFAGASRTPVPVDELRIVLRGLRRGAGVGARLAAAVLPRSLVAAWLPQRAASPPAAG